MGSKESQYGQPEQLASEEARKTVGDIAINTPEQKDQFHEIKEILHQQKAEALSGYNKFTEDLGAEKLSEEDFEKTLAFNMKKWETDGSLNYLRNWLKNNPDHKVYLSASPNKVIPSRNLLEAAEKFLVSNASHPMSVVVNRVFLSSYYSDEEIFGTPKQDEHGSTLPVQLMVWTDVQNLDEAPLPMQILRVKDLHNVMASISDQTIPQTLGHWYRLRESEDFGGIGIFEDWDDAGSGQQLFASPKWSESDGLRCIPCTETGIDGRLEHAITKADLNEPESFPARFIIS